jgi:outer membrane protein OmpA-like peptidoglycan-associated protein
MINSNGFYQLLFILTFALILSSPPALAQSSSYNKPYRPMLTAPKKVKKSQKSITPPQIVKVVKPPSKPVNKVNEVKAPNSVNAEENLEDIIIEPNTSEMAEQLIRAAPLNESEKRIMADVDALTSSAAKDQPARLPAKTVKKDKQKSELTRLSSLKKKETTIIYPEKVQKPISGIKNYDLETVSIPFLDETTDLNEDLASDIKNRIIPMLNENISWRIQIQAFASESLDKSINARRLSLSRALKVREFLLENGIKPVRIDVRALGTQTDQLPIDRVDLLLINPQNG